MSVPSKAQLGVKDEVTYGTTVTPDRFFEYNKEGVKLAVERIESAGLRKGTRTLRSDRFVPNRKGASGDVEIEVLTKGFGFWLKHMLGAVATTGPNVDGKYTHTGTIDALLGDFFTLQVNRPFHPADTDQAFTYHGGKVASWKLANSVDGLLICTLSLDFEDEDTATGLASASYPTATQPLSFAGGLVTVGGAEVHVTEIEITGDNKLKTDRHFLRNSTLKKEPVEAGLREVMFSMTGDFENLTQYNRFVSATASGALAQIVATWTGPVAIAASSFPDLVATLPAARFDGETPGTEGPEPLSIKLTGKALFDGTNSAVSLAYGTADATP